MNDKQWLDMVARAAHIYCTNHTVYGSQARTVTEFVQWLYSQWGIVYQPPLKSTPSKPLDNNHSQ